MKRNLLLLGLLCAFTFTDLLAEPPSDIRTKNGIKRPDLPWPVIPSKDSLTLITKILTEKPIGGRSFQPAAFEGKRCYTLTRTFQGTAGDAYNGKTFMIKI